MHPNVSCEAPFDLPAEDDRYKSLVPIIFNHGYGGASYQYQGLYGELASHGYLVISMDSNAGGCSYTQKENGEPVLFNMEREIFDYD